MSDEEGLIYVRKLKTIHYGSLENQERNRLVTLQTVSESNIDQNIRGNVNLSNGSYTVN